MLSKHVLKPNDVVGKKIEISVFFWKKIIFRFSKYNFFLNFFLTKTNHFSLLLQSKNFTFLAKNNFDFINLKKILENFKILNFSNYNWKNLKTYFFCEFRILGLGLRLKKGLGENFRAVKLDIGHSHYISYILPPQVKCIRRKKKFVIFSYDLLIINKIIRHFENYKEVNPYKIRGLKNLRKSIRVKSGKKQNQK
jgi:hypothetical protein